MNIGIVGLGLIGGSMAKTIKENTAHKVFGFDIDKSTMLASHLTEAIDEDLSHSNIGECDLIIISLYPNDTIKFVENNANNFKKGAIVTDCSGVKRVICDKLIELANKNDFYFVGGHPMAGTHFWGFNYSRASLFKGASMIIITDGVNDINILEKIKDFFLSLGFGSITYTTADEHDRIIAYTSQLAHIVSSAYVKSPTALSRKGFCAGSYKDMTRVAKLNEKMWTELFFDNKDYLSQELDEIIKNLQDYSDAIKSNNKEKMCSLLKDGRETKRQAG